MALEDDYQVTVNSPCPGSLQVDKDNDTTYLGSGTGIFSSMALLGNGNPGAGWILIAIPSDQSSPCYPVAVFDQQVPNDDDPVGNYVKRGTAGTATVT